MDIADRHRRELGIFFSQTHVHSSKVAGNRLTIDTAVLAADSLVRHLNLANLSDTFHIDDSVCVMDLIHY